VKFVIIYDNMYPNFEIYILSREANLI